MVMRKLPRQPVQQRPRTLAIAIAQRRNCQQQTRIRKKVMSLFRGDAELLDARRVVRLSSCGPQEPAHRRGLKAEQVIFYAHGEISVIVRWLRRQQFLGDGSPRLHIAQGSEVAFLDQGKIVTTQSIRHRTGKERIGLFGSRASMRSANALLLARSASKPCFAFGSADIFVRPSKRASFTNNSDSSTCKRSNSANK